MVHVPVAIQSETSQIRSSLMQGSMLKGQMANLLGCSHDSVSSSTATAGSASPNLGSLGDWGVYDHVGCGWVSL